MPRKPAKPRPEATPPPGPAAPPEAGESRQGQEGQGFYEEALSRAQRVRLPRARKLQGLEEEVALLRVKLQEALEQSPQDSKLLLRHMEVLVKVLGAHYRLSKRSEEDLYQNIVGVIKGIGEALWPEGAAPPSTEP